MLGSVPARLALSLAAFATAANACGDHLHARGHSHEHVKRGISLLTPPTRPLVWGELNIVHTTDSHGWLLGHQKASPPEPNYSADFGDFASFVRHMKEIAKEKGVDLLLVDSGDLHDGTGLSDGFPPGGIDVHDSNQFIKKLPYDLLAIGNHELYVYNSTLDTHTDFAPHWNGRYLSSNVNITIPSSSDASQNVSVPVGERFAKFTTALGKKVTSLGVLFDFTGNDDGTTVQKVEDMVKEQWFSEVIAEEPDLFLLAGHMPVSKDKWPTVFNAIRAVHPQTPILIFGGHAHIRDCTQFDGRSMALASGRYMETVVGSYFPAGLNFSQVPSTGNLSFSRRYLDTNRLIYEFHTGRSNNSFDTPNGLDVSQGLRELAERFDLNFTYGIAPQDYTLTRDPYPSNGSSLSLFIEQAVPIALKSNTTQANTPALFVANSGSQRFDILKGAFTKNDQLTASPFTNSFLFVSGVEYGVAKQVVGKLNEEYGADGKRKRSTRSTRRRGEWMKTLYEKGDVEMRYNAWLEDMDLRYRVLSGELGRRDDNETVGTMGYVTTDSCPGIGDDTIHTPPPHYSSPVYISSQDSSSNNPLPGVSDDSTLVNFVFADFIETDVLEVLNEITSEQGGGGGKTFSESDVATYASYRTNEVWGVFASAAWN
ncbi:uncharacterized protein FOMMEDRAFT_86703 [Fomitiporia mediterranea MF3/22]|uniref:uncharacterized protein n=1 Tax=Fomitiporia mediterranea (strain MF3/22) TaxID=694068 RepID=UPI0004408626|nr:uncharacterized protein FOMMEDRAFT_86703 [Fomitiporia mediterranea MF3/22]EJD02037.1 hypothetical protein FOMMEDRAFT_86703 [Fomitiporia mediterranea MF3/22]